MLGSDPCRLLAKSFDHRAREFGVLPHGGRSHLRVIGLGLEAEAYLVSNPQTQLGKLAVAGGRRDRLVHLEVSQPGGLTIVAGILVGLNGAHDSYCACRGVAFGCGSSDLLLDQGPEVQGDFQLLPLGLERPVHHRIGSRSPLRNDHRAAVTAPVDGHVAEHCQSAERLPNRRRTDLEHARELADRRQLLADHEVTEGNRGDEAISDPSGCRFDQ